MFIGHRVWRMLHEGSFEKMLDGEAEVDKPLMGGKARNMHADERARRITGRGPTAKAIVLGMLAAGSSRQRSSGTAGQERRSGTAGGSG